MIAFTPWAERILSRSAEASRRLNPDARLRLFRTPAGGVDFGLADGPEPGDETVEHDGFTLFVEAGLRGTVDVIEPHDRLILRAPGDTERTEEHPPRPSVG